MNTIRSTWLGWGVLIVAGGGSYYFAKRSINADRASRHEEDMRRKRLTEQLEFNATHQPTSNRAHAKTIDHAGDPSAEASHDPARSEHLPPPKSEMKSKYEPKEVFRQKKGDRFS